MTAEPSGTETPSRDASRAGGAARALGLCGLVGASLALCIGHAFTIGAGPFLRTNNLSHVVRQRLFVCVTIGLVLGAGAGALWMWRRGLPAVVRVAHLFAPLALAGAIPVVLALEGWADTLVAALACMAVVLALEPALRLSLAVAPPVRINIPEAVRRWAPLVIVCVATVFYAIYMAHFTVQHHRRWNTMSYDLGQFDNEFYNALHGHPFRDTALIRGGNWTSLRGHASFTLYALLPIYALAPGAETLLRLQSVLIAAGVIPIYWMTSRRLGRGVGCLLALTYLAYPPLHGANFYDFHFQPVAATFTLFALDALDRRRHRLFGVLFALALGCREDIAVGWAVFGGFLVLSGWRPRAGLVIAGVSVAYFVMVKFVVMPHFGSWWFSDIYKDLYPKGENDFGGVFKTILTNPGYVFRTWVNAQKLSYAVLVLLPLAFLPLRGRLLWLLCISGAFFTLLTTDYTPTTSIGFQYTAYWIPWIFPAAAFALAQMDRVQRRAALGTLVVATFLASFHWGAIPPRKEFHAGFFSVEFKPPDAAMIQKERDLRELINMVPKDAPLAVSERELPHVSTRLDCYSLRDGFEGADWILYGTDLGSLGSAQGMEAREKGLYELVAERPSLVLLRRVHEREP